MAEAELETTLLLWIKSIVAKGTQNGEYSIAVSTLVRPEPLAAAIVPALPGAHGQSPARVCYLSDSFRARMLQHQILRHVDGQCGKFLKHQETFLVKSVLMILALPLSQLLFSQLGKREPTVGFGAP